MASPLTITGVSGAPVAGSTATLTGGVTQAPAYSQIATQPSSQLGSPTTSVASFAPSTPGGTQPSGVFTGGSSSSTAVDPAVAAFLGQQISAVQNQIAALDPQQSVGNANILSSANNATNNENQSFGQATRDYNTQQGNTVADELTAKENIDTGIRDQTNALQRLLGLAGSGNSSASQTLAPYAASRQGDIQRAGVQTSYGRNLASTDTAYGDTTQAHQKNLGDIGQQEFENQQNLASSIANTKATLLQTLAGLTLQKADAAGTSLPAAESQASPYMQQIAQIIAGTAALGNQYQNPIQLTAPSVYQAPSLDSYNYDISAPPTIPGGTTTPADPTNPVAPIALSPLQKQQSVLAGQ